MVLRTYILLVLIFHSIGSFGQIGSKISDYEGRIIGGPDHLDQILQTQLTLPKLLINSDFKTELVAYFDIDSLGNAVHLKIDGGLNNVLRNETKRMFEFLKFRKTPNLPVSQPYYLIFNLSTEKYNRYIKQKNKLNLKKNVLADSSGIIYSKADIAPEYYKNGEEGLGEYILSEIEYPKLAIEKSIEGTVILDFVVETNGYATNITVKKAVNTGLTEEAIRLIKLTRWQPALSNGKLVRYKTSYPITFSLRNVNRDASSTIGQ